MSNVYIYIYIIYTEIPPDKGANSHKLNILKIGNGLRGALATCGFRNLTLLPLKCSLNARLVLLVMHLFSTDYVYARLQKNI